MKKKSWKQVYKKPVMGCIYILENFYSDYEYKNVLHSIGGQNWSKNRINDPANFFWGYEIRDKNVFFFKNAV